MPPTLFDLAGRVAIVTGSSRGLGKEMARGLGEAGAKVVVCSWDAEETEATARELCDGGLEALALPADVSSRSDCERLVSAAVAHFGSLDVMVCNAGIDIILPAERYEDDQWNRIIEVNLRGCFNAAQLAGRWMIEHGTRGSIIMTSSIAGGVGIPGLVPYAASKGGVNQLARTLAVEWAGHGIRVNCIAPGYFENAMQGVDVHVDPEKKRQIETFTPMRRRGSPAELVGPVLFLASDASSYVTGHVLYVDGGYTAA